MRRSGILLPISALPSAYGIGDFGPEAFRFLRFLKSSGQSVWAILPLLMTDKHGSPYSSPSAFALNPLLISPDLLFREGLVTHKELQAARTVLPRVNYAFVAQKKDRLLRSAFTAFRKKNGGKQRFPDFCQKLAQTQWDALRVEAHRHGIHFFGDLPFYVAHKSDDTALYPQLFSKNFIAGAPPDDFFPTGQLWKNPVYAWPRHRQTHFRWWLKRVERALDLYDLVRLDHFRGFESVWVIPKGKKPEDGRWQKVPGDALLRAMTRRFGHTRFIAEDIGHITSHVDALRKKYGFSGTRIVQAGFHKASLSSQQYPGNYPTHSVAYTGTHDMATLADWWKTVAKPDERKRAQTVLHWKKPSAPVWPLIELGMNSKASLFITPMQDLLELGASARMNTPGVKLHNWTWRLPPKINLAPVAKKLLRMTKATLRARPDSNRRSSP